jgi:ParB family chromosome partitioning protein
MTSKSKQPYMGQLTALNSYLSLDDAVGTENALLLERIHLPQQQPRRYFDPQKMQGLVESVKKHGILEPLLVRPLQDGNYELVAGERRYRAAQTAGLIEVPVLIRDFNDQEAFQIALIENLQREDLNPIEETEGILQLIAFKLKCAIADVPPLLYRMKNSVERGTDKRHNIMPQSNNSFESLILEVFDGLGLMSWESFVKNRLPLLNMPIDVLDALRRGRIAYTKALAIARVKDESQRSELLKTSIQEDLSLSQIRERIKTLRPISDSESPKAEFETVTRRVLKAKLWKNSKKWKQVQSLLAKLDALLVDE